MGRACRKHGKHQKGIKICILKARTMETIFRWGISLSYTRVTVRQTEHSHYYVLYEHCMLYCTMFRHSLNKIYTKLIQNTAVTDLIFLH